MSLRLRNVQLDVPADRYDLATSFWVAALGASGTQVTDGGSYTHLREPRSLVGVHLQRLGDGAPRVHLDLDADDVGAEVSRLVGLGATRVAEGPCTVLRDPGGNRLCVCRGDGPSEPLRDAPSEGARLHVLVIDVASAHAEATARFWGGAIGIRAEHLPPPYDPYWRLEDVPVPGGSMRVLVQDIGPDATPRIHLDLHVPGKAERDAEVRRLVGLGAAVVAEGDLPWTVLRDPVGTVLCVVPDA